jgi:hypothetical protein
MRRFDMENIYEKSITVNAITGPKVSGPAVSPETLLEFQHPYFSFLLNYTITGKDSKWHGQLKNIGRQFNYPDSILCPIEITEYLGLSNIDTVEISLCMISEARIITYRKIRKKSLSSLKYGIEIKTGDSFEYEGQAIEILKTEPSTSFYSPSTLIIEDEDSGLKTYYSNYTTNPEHVETTPSIIENKKQLPPNIEPAEEEQ